MTTILEKMRVLAAGSIHELLNKGIDANSIVVVRQYVRDLEQAQSAMNAQVAVARGRASNLTLECNGLSRQMSEIDDAIEANLNDGDESNDVQMLPLQLEANRLKKKLEQRAQSLKDAEVAHDSLLEAFIKVKERCHAMRDRLAQLKQLEADTKTAHQTASALEQVASISSTDAGESIDNVESRMRERNMEARARLEAALGGMGPADDSDALELAKAQADLSARRAQRSATAS